MRKNFSYAEGENIVNKYKLIYVALIISILSIAVMSILNYRVVKSMMISEARNSGMKITDQVSKQIIRNRASLEAMEKILEEKIKIASQNVISEKDNLSSENLQQLKERLNVDEISWIDRDGKTIYTTYEGYKDWTVPEGHPLDLFSKSDSDFMVEEVRPNSEFEILTKYGAMKAEDGKYVQIGIRAKNIENITRDFSYQKTVEDLKSEENIEYAYILDEKFTSLADSNKEMVGTVYSGYEKFEEGLGGQTVLNELYDDKSDSIILEIVQPVELDKDATELVVMGFSMEKPYETIDNIMDYSIIITSMMAGMILWIQNKNILVPVRTLHNNIRNIDLEKESEYRLPMPKNDTFRGIAQSINHILNNASNYLRELEENKREIRESKEIISSAYQQLAASEEALRLQYGEIQSYTEKIEDLKQKYEIAVEATNSAVWEIDVECETIYFSKELKNIIGNNVFESNDLGSKIEAVFGDESREKFLEEYRLYTNKKKEELYIQIDYEGDQKKKKLLFQGKGIYRDGALKTVSGIVLDITKLKEQENYIEYLAYNDFLTGLPNRRTFLKKLESEIAYGNSGAVILLDLDNFKEVNDVRGHIYGDKLLGKISEKLNNLSADDMFISRFGGDEFLIMVQGRTDDKALSNYADRIIDMFKRDIVISKEGIFVSCSMGITKYPEDGKDSGQLIMNADMAMYKVKNNGKGDYSFFNKEMITKVQEKVSVEKHMREAIKNNGFKLLYQPQVDVESGDISGFEALVRIKDKFISPGVFIPIAEESDIIIDLGRYVTEEAIRQLREWKDKGFSGKPVSINFSAKQLKDSEYADFIEDRLNFYGIDSSEIEIEVTESVFLKKQDEPLRFLEKLKNMGIRISLDDFGTGYSSLSYLTFLPVDKIKLDKSLSDRFLELDNVGVMDSLILLAHSLNLEVIAEGVECKEQYKKLKKGKCDKIQGYLFSKPLESHEAETIYSKNFLKEI